MKRKRLKKHSRINTKNIRLDPDTHDLFMTLKREISDAQNVDVSIGETIRRTRNIPGIRTILIDDAKQKRRLRKR